MKNTLFAATYYNNPHFIRLQKESFSKFVEDEYDFAVLDDSTPSTNSLLSGNNAREEISKECEKYGVKHIQVPQHVHQYIENGGLVHPDNKFAGLDHTTVRHQSHLKWILTNYKQLGFDQYQTLVLLDADMFIKKTLNIKNYMEDYDMMGAWRELSVKEEHLQLNTSEEVKNMLGTNFKFYTMCLLFINMQTVKNLETFDNDSFVKITDTGGKSKYFIENNPQYKFGFLRDFNSQEYRLDFFSKTASLGEDAEICHYRSGSMWDHQSKVYYMEKLHRMLKKFIPDLYHNEYDQNINYDLPDRWGYHTFKKEK